jgi:hypothetical protein
MNTLTLSLKHVRSNREQPCGVCRAQFVPAEDSGSRVLSIAAAEQPPFSALMCGGCFSKWSHGATVTARGGEPGPA